jgi:antitoxin (DNA-binding transcriptional repressor) of toxin-antitoxin stability system
VYTYIGTYENDAKMRPEVTAMKMAGIREVRASFAGYLSGAEPFLITKHGKVSGVYIPLESPDRLPDDWRKEIGKILSHHFSRLLESKGVKEKDVREDFRAYRSRRRRR